MRPEFEEKTYETAANVELIQMGSSSDPRHCCLQQAILRNRQATVEIWAPGQALEGALGFDVLVALDGSLPELDRLLRVALPSGTRWRSHHPALPSSAGSAPEWASLFLQYKRSHYIVKRHSPYKHWHRGPFYRFQLQARQQRLLAHLNAAVRKEALIYYVAPRFHTNDDFSYYRTRSLVIERSAFISPTLDPDHTVASYDEYRSVLHSEPTLGDALGFSTVLSHLARLPSEQSSDTPKSLADHIHRLASAVREVTGLSTTRLTDELAHDIHGILSLAVRTECSWFLASVPGQR